MNTTLNFFGRLAFFSLREEISSFSSILGGLLLYPCFIWIYSKLWLGLNDNFTTIGSESLFLYIGLTEILFMTSLREFLIDRTSSDFSLSFVRPRSWLLCSFVSIFTRTLIRRFFYLILFLTLMPIFSNNHALIFQSGFRFLLLVPFLTIFETLYSLLFVTLQIRFFSVKNFRMLFGKLFLIFGGVLAPLSDIPNKWSNVFLNTPFSDLIFQPCYFSLKGEFYLITPLEWFLRMIFQLVFLLALNICIYNASRRYYHNYGG